jgi:hypothetical protein
MCAKPRAAHAAAIANANKTIERESVGGELSYSSGSVSCMGAREQMRCAIKRYLTQYKHTHTWKRRTFTYCTQVALLLLLHCGSLGHAL